jgi:hypothetical protein
MRLLAKGRYAMISGVQCGAGFARAGVELCGEEDRWAVVEEEEEEEDAVVGGIRLVEAAEMLNHYPGQITI